MHEQLSSTVADLGEGPGGPAPLILAKKSNEEMQMEEKPAGQVIFANQITKNPAPRPLVQALDPPLL